MAGGGIGRRKKTMLVVNNWVLKVGAALISETIMQGANPCPVIARLLLRDVSISRYTRGR